MIARYWNKLYGQRWNPIYQSGTLAVFFLLVAVASGLAIILFYRVGDPYGSVAAMHANPLLSILRTVHRYSSDAMVLAIIVHAAKMAISSRAFGPRARSWLSGLALTGLIIFIGVTGLILVWDQAAQRLALAGIRLVELLPIFSEPPRRIFADQETLGNSFFFMLMFLHMALPLMLAALLWIHTARLSRAVYLPEKALCYFWSAVLVLGAALFPAALDSAANLATVPGRTHIDLWYAFWLPFEERFGGWPTIAAFVLGTAAFALYPLRRRGDDLPPPAFVDNKTCNGCTQCVQDCPYEAISMVKRAEGDNNKLSDMVALVDSDACVSCGICIASCKPMAIGPPELTGRDQLKKMKDMLAKNPIKKDQIVVMGCVNGCGMSSRFRNLEGIRLIPSPCTGSIHTSVMEYILRQGALGLMIATCPERDCSNREGPKWLQERIYSERPAELMARVDKGRVQVVHASRFEADEVAEKAQNFMKKLRRPDAPPTTEKDAQPDSPPTPEGKDLPIASAASHGLSSNGNGKTTNGNPSTEVKQDDPALIS